MPFERFAELKQLIQERKRWKRLDDRWSWFESFWKPKKWDTRFRFLFIRQRVSLPLQGPIQLDLFQPQEKGYDFKAIGTNKQVKAKKVLMFHNGRANQEGLFGELKSQTHFLGNSGTSCRLLLSIAALARGDYLLTGSPRLQNRPIAELVRALDKLGAGTLRPALNGCPPVTLKACGLKGGKVAISGKQSSQFISSILLAAPYAEQDVEIEVLGEMVSEPYIDLTIGIMDRFGVSVVREGSRYFKVTAGKGYQACSLTIEGDISNASYFWAAAALTEGSVTITDLNPGDTRQGDLAILEVLEAMGCRVERGPDWVTVQGAPLQGIDLDISSIPDQVPTVASLALLAEGRTVIRNVSHLRLKESERLAAVAAEWNRLGGRVDELPDGLVIQGGRKLIGAEVDPHDDHRLAVSLAVIGLRVPGIRIRQAECVSKSFPLFWDFWDRL